MNAVNPSAPNKRKAIAEEPTASGFFQALRDKSMYERLITPPGLKALGLTIAVALSQSIILFIVIEDASIAVDLATSLAFIIMFGLVLGTWLGVIFGVVFARLATYALEVLDRRVDKVLARMARPKREDINRSDDNRRADYQGFRYVILYNASFPLLGACLMIFALYGYTYDQASPAVYELLSPAVFSLKFFLCVSLAASTFLTVWMGTSILRVWHLVRTLEKQIDAAELSAEIHAHIPTDISIVGHINRAHMQTVRFVTGVF